MRSSQQYLVDVMTKRQKRFFVVLLMGWFVAQGIFWHWWLNGEHVGSLPRFIFTTIILSWTLLMPGYFFFFVARMKKPNPALPIPDFRVAMVVTKVPSEPFSVLQRTLLAALRQDYPHDTWLADEDPLPETIAWCRQHGVHISSRKGVTAYHRDTWPRRTKCKEGNLAYFYDRYGYERYDIVSQLDADHRPEYGYLRAMVRPFADPSVGYVSAPSICDANAKRSWAARARLYAESTLHGALQAGYNGGWAPLCIGSHYAVRTAALRKIGGLGPELAEDHSTTFLMQAHGFKGVHAFDATSRGDGPLNFADCMTQEFQWSRSLVVLLLTLTPKYFRRLPLRLKFQFLFSQSWYPLFATALVVSYLMIPFALLTGKAWVNVPYIGFLLYNGLITLATLCIVTWVKYNGWLRPHSAKIISWEVILFQLTRWPWILMGCIFAVMDVRRKKPFVFRVTPKGANGQSVLPIKIMLPYVVVVASQALAAICLPNAANAKGYYFFALLNSLIYTGVICVIIIQHKREQVSYAKT